MKENNVKLAKNIVNYSLKIQPKEKVLIESTVFAKDLIKALVNEVYKANAYPFVHLQDAQITREILNGTSTEHCNLMTKYMSPVINDMDAYIGISGGENVYELSDVPESKMKTYSVGYSKPIHHDVRVTKTKWVILKYPTGGVSQLAGTSTENFKKFYYNVCNLNYQKMNDAMTPLKELMERTDKVHIVAPNTDLTFSIKGIKAIKCAGEMNIPDGEIYTAPIKNSVNGTITYNVPTLYSGKRFDNVCLTFKDGKIVDASCSSGGNLSLNKILDTDEGARYVGEFAIGVNPYILEPMLDILFDEKMCGSIHFTPGSCYNDAYNGNDSAVHWDMVLNQRTEAGGGEIWFDDVLVRKDGLFVLDELKGLNPEALK
ncbi:MAG: aminopeptidase [Christensenellales bacterium]